MDHLCAVRSCINPGHLEAVTTAENVWRSAKAKLKPDDVWAIRASAESARVLAERYGVNRSAIYNIRSGATWAKLLSPTT